MPKKFLTAVVALSVVMAGALPAFADEDDLEPAGFFDSSDGEVVEVDPYDPVEHIYRFATPDGDCMLMEEVTVSYEPGEDGSILFAVSQAAEGEDPVLLEGCVGISVEGPNGQVNHGTFVSSMMHALKELGIKGSDKKEFKAALKGYGKGEWQVKVKDVDDELTLDEGDSSDSEKVKPAKADKVNKGQMKKANKANKGQNK